MEEEKLVCGSCGNETFRPPKDPPVNAREARQVRFHCEHCGVANLRDGSTRGKKVQEVQMTPKEESEAPKQNKEEPSAGRGVFAVLVMAVLGVVAAFFLKKGLKGPGGGGSGTGNSSGNAGQGPKFPWSPVS